MVSCRTNFVPGVSVDPYHFESAAYAPGIHANRAEPRQGSNNGDQQVPLSCFRRFAINKR